MFLLILGRNEFVTLAVDVDDLNLRIVLQMLAQLGDIDIHGACIEVVVINPDGLQCEVALQNLVGMLAEQCQQLFLLGGQLGLLVTYAQQLLLRVEREVANVVEC